MLTAICLIMTGLNSFFNEVNETVKWRRPLKLSKYSPHLVFQIEVTK